MPGRWRAWGLKEPRRSSTAEVTRRLRVVSVSLALGLAGACGGAEPADTAPVPVAEGMAGEQAWRLVGRRQGGQPCLSLVIVRANREEAGRCGVRRTPLRHLDPVTVPVGPRLVVFSPLSDRARRVRVDTADGAIRIEPARAAAGFPARFFVVDLDLENPPMAVRVFAEGGRAVVT